MKTLSETELQILDNLRLPPSDLMHIEKNTIVEGVAMSLQYVHGSLLDLGCGAQPYANLLTERVSSYIGTDLRPNSMIAPTVCSDSLTLPFKANVFDTVLCTQVLEHVRNPFMTMSEIGRVLRVGGHAVMTMPALWPLHEEPFDYFRYTRYGLEELARVSDLQVVSILERGGAIAAIGQLVGTVVHDALGDKSLMRIPAKLLVAPFLAICKWLDPVLFYPKLTLGYIMVAQKTKSI